MRLPESIRAPGGKLGVLLSGLGVVATTLIAGCLAVRTVPTDQESEVEPSLFAR